MTLTLPEVLDGYGAAILKEIVKGIGHEPYLHKKQNIEYVQLLMEVDGHTEEALQKMGSAEIHTLARLLQVGGQSTYIRLHTMLQNDGIIPVKPPTKNRAQQTGRHAYKGDPTFADIIARLTRYGLVLSHTQIDQTTSKLAWNHGRFIFIPKPVQNQLDSSQLPQLDHPDRITPEYINNGSVVAFQRYVANYVRALREFHPVNLTTDGLIYKTSLKKIVEEVNFPANLGRGTKESDNGFYLFLRFILTRAVLLVNQFDIIEPAAPSHNFWQLGSTEKIKKLFDIWRTTTAWNGLMMLPSYKTGGDFFRGTNSLLVKSRQTILGAIKKQGDGWWSLDGLVEVLRTNHYRFLFPKRDFKFSYYGYYNGYNAPESGTPYGQGNNPLGLRFVGMNSEQQGWDLVEAAYIRHVVVGPLYWMGLVDLGYLSPPKDDFSGIVPSTAYRLTEFGRWLVGDGAMPVSKPDQIGGLIVQPNFDILAMAPVSVETLMALDSFAKVKDSQQHVTTYELTRDTVYRGQQGRWPASDILVFLNENAKMPVPDNVHRSLEEWAVLHERITIHKKVHFLHVADEEIAAAMAELPEVKRVGATTLVSSADYKTTLTAVREAGYLPLQTAANDRTAANSIAIAEDGAVRFLHKVPSIFAAQALSDISVSIDDSGTRQIIPAMLKAETASGRRFGRLLNKLKVLSSAELSDNLILNLKAWSNYYGGAQQETVTLIEFKDVATRDELCADENLKDYLQPFSGNRPLAVIEAGFEEAVAEHLKRRGIGVSIGLQR